MNDSASEADWAAGAADPAARRPNAVAVVCTDRRRSLAFYRDGLGAEVLDAGEYGCPWVRVGGLVLTLVPNAASPAPPPAPPPDPPRPGAGLLVFADDVPAAVGRAVAAGAAVVEPPTPDGDRTILADPDGVLIELLKRECPS